MRFGCSAVTSNEFHIQDTEEEVLPLNLSRDADYDFASNGRSNIQSSLKPTKKIFTKGKNLLPLKNARTSRFDRPANTLSHNFTDFVETAVDVTSKDSLSDQTDIEEDEVEIDAEDSWGRVGGYHVSKREVLQGEADERGKGSQEDNNREQLELFEVCRIQKNARQRLQEDDYGCDVMDETQAHKQEESSSKSASMAATATINFSDAKGAITHLLATEPELLALLDDFALSSVKLNPTRAAVRNLQINSANNYPKLGFGLLYRGTVPSAHRSSYVNSYCHRCRYLPIDILIIYMAVLTYYACIRSSPIYQQVGAILARNVLPRIVDLREALSVLEDLGVVSLPDEESRESAYANDERAWDERAIDCQNILPSEASDSKYQDIQAEVQENKRIDGMKSDFPARKRSMYENDRTSYEGNDPIAYMPPRKRRKRRAAKVSLHSSKSDIPSKASTIPKPHPISDMDLLEANTLTDAEASEKAGRRKSLRFYTSKIDAKAAKRSDAGVARAGGDSDVPYRSKERARAAVLQRQQNVHSSIVTGTRQDSEELGEVDFQSFGQAMRDTDAEGYYDLVAREKRALKFAKKEAYDETRENER